MGVYNPLELHYLSYFATVLNPQGENFPMENVSRCSSRYH